MALLEKAIPSSKLDEVPLIIAIRKPIFELSFSIILLIIVSYAPDVLYISPVQRGFFCNDLSIMLPKLSEIVSTTNLFIYTFGIVIICVLLVELYSLLFNDSDTELVYGEYGKTKLWRYILRVLNIYGYAMIGYLITYTLTTVAKYAVGRHRPRFIDVCKPNLSTCNAEFITEYECTNNNIDDINDSRKSFFSGHSSYSMFSATFITLYIFYRLQKSFALQGALCMIQLIVFSSGLFIGWSRYVDHSHHWSDVLMGQFVGATIAYLIITITANRFIAKKFI